MNNRAKLIFAIGGFALFMCICIIAYNTLAAQRAPEDSLQILQSPETSARESEETPGPEEAEGEEESEAEVRKITAPDFTVVDGDGNEVSLSDFKGTPVVLNFWASWCPPCKAEMPYFDEVWQEVGDEVAFMMVDMVSVGETQEQGAAYIAENGYSFPVYYDVNQHAAVTYGISSIPTSLFIDAEGYVVSAARGAISKEALLKGVGLLQGGPEDE